jgi:hypothetical protein
VPDGLYLIAVRPTPYIDIGFRLHFEEINDRRSLRLRFSLQPRRQDWLRAIDERPSDKLERAF